MGENKITRTGASVEDYIASIAELRRRYGESGA
jgi:hypothetical protein